MWDYILPFYVHDRYMSFCAYYEVVDGLVLEECVVGPDGTYPNWNRTVKPMFGETWAIPKHMRYRYKKRAISNPWDHLKLTDASPLEFGILISLIPTRRWAFATHIPKENHRLILNDSWIYSYNVQEA